MMCCHLLSAVRIGAAGTELFLAVNTVHLGVEGVAWFADITFGDIGPAIQVLQWNHQRGNQGIAFEGIKVVHWHLCVALGTAEGRFLQGLKATEAEGVETGQGARVLEGIVASWTLN